MDFYTVTSQETLERISRHCPEALSTYLQCINRANENGYVFFSKEVIEVNMSEEFSVFRKNIKKLARENLLEWQPYADGFSITLVDNHEND